jgi:hypothetical protein
MAGSAIVQLNDADIPQVTLTLASHAVSEKAGSSATTGTVTRDPASPSTVIVELFSSDTNAAQVPLQVTLAPNTASVDFPVAAVDDGVVTPPRTNLIGGFVLANGTSTPVAQIKPDTLVINDADGASLHLAIANATVKEGLSPATIATVTRNTPATNSLTVSLKSSDPLAIVPPTVTITQNLASASFAVATLMSTNAGNHNVTLTASAAGFSDGTCALLVTDTNLPDLAVTSVTAPATAQAQGFASVSYHVVNQGYGPVTTNFLTRVYLATDKFGANEVLAGQFEFQGTLPVGEFFDQTLTIFTPRDVGNYWVIVQTDPEGNVAEIQTANNTAASPAPIAVGAPYQAWVKADLHNALAGTSVPMHGSATNSAGAPAQYVEVDIHVVVRGTERIVSAITDAAGNYSINFQPLPGEAGNYQVWAAAPGVSAGATQDSFVLVGMVASVPGISVQVPEGSINVVQVTLQNLSDVPLHGLQAAVGGALPAGIQVALSPSATNLAGSGSVLLNCTFSAAPGSAGGAGQINVSSTEGATATIPFAVTVQRLRPVLVAYPDSLVAGMARGHQVNVGFDVVNTGTLATGPITLSLPTAPWLQLASTNPMPALAPGQTNHVTLLLTPAIDLQLGPYGGSLALNCDQASLGVPFNFRCLSEAKGDLLITAQDDYTFFAAGSPNLAGAAVSVLDVYSHAVITNGVTDTNGLFFAAQLSEGYYEVQATAPGHTSYDSTQLLLAGQTNAITVFLPLQTVQYVWSVVPTEIPDRTRITLVTTFETAVPVPVITVDPAVIHMGDLSNSVNQINLTIANHGLVAGESAKLELPYIPGWTLTALITNLGTLPAMSSLVVPLIISPAPQAKISPITDVAGDVAASWICGGSRTPILFTGDNTPAPPLNVINWFSGGGGGAGGGGGGGGGSQGIAVSQPGNSVIAPQTCDTCIKGLLGAGENCVWDFVGSQIEADVLNCLFSLLQYTFSGYESPTNQFDPVTGTGALLACLKLPGAALLAPIVAVVDCAKGAVQASLNCALVGATAKDAGPKDLASQVPEGVVRKLPALLTFAQRADRLNAYLGVIQATFGDPVWLNATGTNYTAFVAAFSSAISTNSDAGLRISTNEVTGLLALPLPDGLTSSNVTQLINRWNRTLDYYAAGITNLGEVPNGQSTDFIAVDMYSQAVVAMTNAAALNQADGFSDPISAVRAASDNYHAQLLSSAQGGGGSVCAKVVLQLDQQAVMSREAFKATLQIINNSTSVLENVSVIITAKDQANVDSTARFGINPPTLQNMTGVDGTGVVPPGLTGTATWTLVPTVDAAPTNATVHYISGVLSYVQDGILITVPLTAVPITVHPIPQLYIQYFLQRDVYADDPFTPQIEPSIPFNLAVMIANRGYGTANQFQITSAQPKIIDNQKGLLIDFQIIGSQVNGQNLTPSLTVNFGDIAPGAIDIGRWLLVSSLQGQFDDYQATFQAEDDFGNKKTAIVQDVAIHEMIHLVQAQGAFEDGKPDFLVDDVANVRHLPDRLYLSDGTTNPVTVLETSTVDSAPSAGHLQVQLTAPMPAGWTYLLVPDPGNGQFTLTRVVRSDGVEIYFNTNVWTTDRTFIGLGRPPVYEHNLHLLDYSSPGAYTLYYTPAATPDTIAPSSSVAALPANSPANFQVQWSGQDNPGGSGIAVYDIFVSTNGGVFAPWLQQTRSASALFQGTLGNHYAFYSVATDQAGNREAAHGTPDASTSVSIANQPPVLTPVPTQSINAGDTFLLTLSATDPNGPNVVLTYRLGPDAPAGATLDPNIGLLTWPTSRCATASTNVFSAIVTDNLVPPLSATGLVRVVVVKSNAPPVLQPIANVGVNEGDHVSIPTSALDPNCPPNAITFSLGAGAPTGTAIDPVTGIFTWTPAVSQAPSTNVITVVATASTVPPLIATQQFTIVVRHLLHDFVLSLGSTNLFPGETNSVPVWLTSLQGLTNLAFVLAPTQGRLSQLSLQGVSSEVSSFALLSLASNRWGVNLSLNSALNLVGQRVIGNLQFVAVTNDHSAIVPVAISNTIGQAAGGRVFTNPATADGLVIVVSREPVLMAGLGPWLAIYGHPGAGCTLQYRTNLTASAAWTAWTHLVMTSRVVIVSNPLLPARTTYYRAYEQSAILPALSIQRLGGPVFGLTLNGQPGQSFTLQNATNLSLPTFWSDFLGVTLTNSSSTVNWTNPGERQRFFRIVPK